MARDEQLETYTVKVPCDGEAHDVIPTDAADILAVFAVPTEHREDPEVPEVGIIVVRDFATPREEKVHRGLVKVFYGDCKLPKGSKPIGAVPPVHIWLVPGTETIHKARVVSPQEARRTDIIQHVTGMPIGTPGRN